MNSSTIIRVCVLAIASLLSVGQAVPCSGYKVTVGGSTRFGINYDTWFEHPRIWFETTGIGAAFTGANDQGGSGFTPQSGMNVFGLSFGTLATATPANGTASPDKIPITSRAKYLKDILHTCRTVDEVKAYIEQYDHSFLAKDVFLYTDRSGRYLVVEPYTMTIGDDASYVIANFCPSTVSDLRSIKQQRYINGSAVPPEHGRYFTCLLHRAFGHHACVSCEDRGRHTPHVDLRPGERGRPSVFLS